MERNDVSFSLPTWNREEIRSLTMLQQQSLYANSPYNLNDFKNQLTNVQFVFRSEQQSSLNDFSSRREFNAALEVEIAVFIQFILEAIISDTDSENKDRVSVLSRFKQLLYKVDLCKFKVIPEEWRKYYKNEVIKKIIFQYLGKCVHNLSLVELLLMTNSFLRFTIVLFIKSHLLQEKVIQTFQQEVPFYKIAVNLADYFQFFMLNSTSERCIKGRFFAADRSFIKTPHYLLIQQNKKLYLYRKQIKLAKHNMNIPQPLQTQKHRQQAQDKVKRQSNGSNFDKIHQRNDKMRQSTTSSKERLVGEVRQRYFWDCLPCFSSRR